MFSRYLLCTFTLLVTLSVISHARAADPFDSIQISVFPPDGGSAYKQLTPDGVVVGQHLSGDAAPRVFESRAALPAADLRQIKQLFSRVLQQKKAINQQRHAGYKRLVLVRRGAEVIEFEAAFDEPFNSPAVQKIWSLIVKSPAGAW